MKKIVSILFVGVFLFSGCSNTKETSKLKVTTSAYPLELMVKEIGGDFVEVSSMFPPMSDPHSYEPTAKEMIDIQNSDLVLYTSKAEEHFIEEIESTDKNGETKYVSVSDLQSVKEYLGDDAYGGVSHEHEGESHEDEVITDSHLTIAPSIDVIIAKEITTILEEMLPEQSDVFVESANLLISELQEMDKNYEEFAKTQKAPIIVTHDAYGHLTKEYGIEFITLYGAHHDDEPSTKEIVEVSDMMKEENINTVFVEQNDLKNPVMLQISEQTGAKIEVLNNMETKVEGDDSLVGLLEANLEAMKKNA